MTRAAVGTMPFLCLVLLVACGPVGYRATTEQGRQCYWDCRTSNGTCRSGCAAYVSPIEQSACVQNCERESETCLKHCPDLEPSR